MDRLWAPWRNTYITTTLQPINDCFLCALSTEVVSENNLLLYNRDPVLAVMNLYPYNNGHILIAPNRHIADLKDLSPEETSALFELVKKMTVVLEKAYTPHGFNVGMNLGRVAGAGLPGHLHVHIVPRWNGDMNFMPVVGETKVMSEALDTGWGKIRAAMKEMGER